MEYWPGSAAIYGTMHEDSLMTNLHYNTMAMESFQCSYLPAAALEVIAKPSDNVGCQSINKKDLDRSAAAEQYSPSIQPNPCDNAMSSPYNVAGPYDDSMTNIACMQSSVSSLLPNWESSEAAAASCHETFLAEQVQPLLALQAILKSQYGLDLTLEQLLALDALPALLQDNPHAEAPQEDQQAFDLSHIDLETTQDPCFSDIHSIKYGYQEPFHISHNAKQSDYMQLANLGHEYTPLSSPLCAPLHPYKAHDVSSPGSATSSVLTDNENSDYKPLRSPIECNIMNAPIPSLPSIFTPPCFNANLPWLPAADTINRDARLTMVEDDLEVIEPPPQRRKLHGITLEQVLQAEKLQYETTPAPTFGSPSLPRRDAIMTSVDMGLCEMARPDFLGQQPAHTRHASTSTLKSEDVQSQSVAARKRRHKIKEKTERLKVIIPGATRLDTAATFDLAIKYVDFLQAQMVCLENEVSLTQQRASHNNIMMGDNQESFKRALIHRLLSSQDVQHFLSKEGLCIVTESLASRLNFDPASLRLPPSAARTV